MVVFEQANTHENTFTPYSGANSSAERNDSFSLDSNTHGCCGACTSKHTLSNFINHMVSV